MQQTKFLSKISKYQIKEELGRGSMGIVYKAFAPQMDVFVALKVMLQPGHKEAQRFKREAQAMAKMNHPNIIKVYDVDIESDFPYFTMAYIEGTTLKSFLQNMPLDIRLFSLLMAKIGKAIAYAHKQGVIHRDLKPGNILIDAHQEPYLLDFGLAKLTQVDSSLSKTGNILGTPKYMSPQQAKGEKINHLTDIYALGAIFYEMLGGKSLVEGENISKILFNVIHREPVLLRTLNSKLAKDLETICHKAISKDINKRYQSAEEFSEDIERFLHGKLIKAKAANIWEKAWNKLKQNKLISAIVSVSILSLALLWSLENNTSLKGQLHLAQAEKWQKQIKNITTIDKKMEIYIKIRSSLEKALIAYPKNLAAKNKLIKINQKMGLLAKKQKNYLLSFVLLRQSKKLGDKKSHILLKQLEQEKTQQEKKNKEFISKMMKKTLQDQIQEALTDKYIFAIVKMQKPYVIKTLVPYLQSHNAHQRLLAIKALGKIGNTYTKHQKKDSVEWLLSRLATFKSKKMIENSEREIIEIVWALGGLKDKRANVPIQKLRSFAGEGSLLWDKIRVPYKQIPAHEQGETNDPTQFFMRGNINQDKGLYANAIVDYTKAIAMLPGFISAYANRGLSYSRLKKYTKAISDYNRAIALDPRDSSVYMHRGNVYQALKQFNKAIVDYNRAITLDPGLFDAYISRGTSYMSLKQFAKAIQDYNQAIALKPKYHIVYNNRGVAYQWQKMYSKAISDYNRAIALNPQDLNAYCNKADAYLHLKRYNEAISNLSKAIILNPREAKTYSSRANIYIQIKEYKKAIADLNRCISLNPNVAVAYGRKGQVYGYMQKYSKALIFFNKAIALDPGNLISYSNRGVAYLKQGNYSKAIADFTKVIALNPKEVSGYKYRAIAYMQVKQYTRAMADYNATIALAPRDFETYLNRAAIFLAANQHQKAYQDYLAFLKLAPNHPLARTVRAKVTQLNKMLNKNG